MSQPIPDSTKVQSEVSEAINNADANQIKSNLKPETAGNSPQAESADLEQNEQTPFIDEALRTDK
ncbi:MAG: hypothetical protein Q4P13_07635 [Psychrobacter sp.]|nr:hypothetical protein [Psychrobacter sp.]